MATSKRLRLWKPFSHSWTGFKIIETSFRCKYNKLTQLYSHNFVLTNNWNLNFRLQANVDDISTILGSPKELGEIKEILNIFTILETILKRIDDSLSVKLVFGEALDSTFEKELGSLFYLTKYEFSKQKLSFQRVKLFI